MGKEAVSLGLTNGLTWIGYTEEEVEGILKNQVMKHFFESKRDAIADFIQSQVLEYFGEKKKTQFMVFDK
jgi:exosome complex RNA-binding protein Rrp4